METLPDKRQKSPVKIRFKQLADGCKSIYLDTYLNGKRKYEFLKLYIHPETDSETQLANAEAMRMAEEMRIEKLSQLGIEEAASLAGTQEREAATEEQTAKARVRAKRTSREPVTIRAKDLKDGRQSLYLDIYFRGERKYEFLKLYTVPGEDAANAEAMARANAVREQRMAEIAHTQEVSAESRDEAVANKKSKWKSRVTLTWRKLRNGDKSYYLHIRYGKDGENRCCEPLFELHPKSWTG